jgi:hypothetical protein
MARETRIFVFALANDVYCLATQMEREYFENVPLWSSSQPRLNYPEARLKQVNQAHPLSSVIIVGE